VQDRLKNATAIQPTAAKEENSICWRLAIETDRCQPVSLCGYTLVMCAELAFFEAKNVVASGILGLAG
jgi:hypothetical protein